MNQTGMCNKPDSGICSPADVALHNFGVACETPTDAQQSRPGERMLAQVDCFAWECVLYM